jgi:hypothetical protein
MSNISLQNGLRKWVILGVLVLIVIGGQFLFVEKAEAQFGNFCVDHKYWTLNDQFNTWVQDNTMFRCVNVDGSLAARTGSAQGVSGIIRTDAVDVCAGKVEHDIVVHGQLQFSDDRRYNGGFWERECIAFGDIFAANTKKDETTSVTRPGRISFKGEDLLKNDRSVTGFGVQPDHLDIEGISKESDLRTLIIGFTNFILPYVSVLSVFAIVASGFYYLLSFANDELHSKAKNVLMYVVIGVILVMAAVTIVNTLLTVGGSAF